MHCQILFVIAFAIVFSIQYTALADKPSEKDEGWSNDNYELTEDDEYYDNEYSNNKKTYKKNKYGDNDDSYGKKSKDSYGIDDYSYEEKSSKKYNKKDSYGKKSYDNYGDDDDYSYEEKSSKKYNKKDSYGKKSSNKYNDKKYDDSDEDYDKEHKHMERRPSKTPKKPKDLGHMNVYLREPSKDGKRRKPKRFRFPVANYEREYFPDTFGPLISFMPWLPIFADRFTKQTIIYSPTGGVYILPPVISFYGKLISVAQLIASGYASLVSTGAPPPPAVDVAPLVQPGPVVGPGVPTIDSTTGGFKGGVRTEYRSFPRPTYSDNYQEKVVYPPKDDYSKPRIGY